MTTPKADRILRSFVEYKDAYFPSHTERQRKLDEQPRDFGERVAREALAVTGVPSEPGSATS